MSQTTAQAGFPPLTWSDRLRPGVILMIGESSHGSVEIPAAAMALLVHGCSAGLAVCLALEMEEPAGLNVYLNSDGDTAAVALLQGAHWRFEDGRASQAPIPSERSTLMSTYTNELLTKQAIFELLERARCLRAAGAAVDAFGFDEAVSDYRGGARHAAAMAKNVCTAAERRRLARLANTTLLHKVQCSVGLEDTN